MKWILFVLLSAAMVGFAQEETSVATLEAELVKYKAESAACSLFLLEEARVETTERLICNLLVVSMYVCIREQSTKPARASDLRRRPHLHTAMDDPFTCQHC